MQLQFGFLSCPGKFSVMSNCLNFFITDCTVDLVIANQFESVVTIYKLLQVNNSLSQVNAKLLYLPHCVVNVRITKVTLYTPPNIL